MKVSENMKKILPILIVGVLVLSGFGVAALTQDFENQPPSAPAIDGPREVRPNKSYEWSFKAIDPDGDDLYYEIDWRDGEFEEWIGPYESDEEIKVNHTYHVLDYVIIKARAKDIYGTVGNWSDYEIEISENIQQFSSISNQNSRLGTTEMQNNNEIFGNHPPYAPSNYYPAGWNVDVDVNLSWDGGDPDPGDTVTYGVYFGPNPDPPLVAIVGPYPWNQTRIEYDPGTLIYCQDFYMSIVAHDNHGAETSGDTCCFFTCCPPSAPDIDGEKGVVPGEEFDYYFTAISPVEVDVKYYIDWGDGTADETDYYQSGETVTIGHAYPCKGTIIIKAYAEDIYGAVGPEGYYIVKWKPRNIAQSSQQSATGSSSQNVMNIALSSRTLINNGTLSGYVNDTSGNPIEEALVRVHFHGTYEEDYSDSTGYYHVTNIPICYCLKNATCSKEDYKTEWVLLSIAENTTYDFVLNSINNPPETPKMDGPVSPKIGIEYEYIFYTTDPDGDDVSYYIEWGDGAVTDWIGPYASGEEVIVSHTWTAKGIYLLRCKAKDHPYEAESDWLEILIRVPPRNKAIFNSLLLKFLEQFPKVFPILGQLQGMQ